MSKLAGYRGRLEEIPFDFHELIAALAPRVCFISAPLGDSNFKWDSVDRVAAAASQIYRVCWPHYFVRASPCARRLARTADRIEFTLSVHTNGPCYGLVVHFQLLSTRGCHPDAVTFSYCPYSVGQVRDFHPAVPARSQAHERGHPGRSALLGSMNPILQSLCLETAAARSEYAPSFRRSTEKSMPFASQTRMASQTH